MLPGLIPGLLAVKGMTAPSAVKTDLVKAQVFGALYYLRPNCVVSRCITVRQVILKSGFNAFIAVIPSAILLKASGILRMRLCVASSASMKR
jgi:hypothetical protein